MIVLNYIVRLLFQIIPPELWYFETYFFKEELDLLRPGILSPMLGILGRLNIYQCQ